MHTFEASGGTRVHFNGDGSGEAQVRSGATGAEISVPCGDLVEFVAELVRRARTSKLDDMSAAELLGMDDG